MLFHHIISLSGLGKNIVNRANITFHHIFRAFAPAQRLVKWANTIFHIFLICWAGLEALWNELRQHSTIFAICWDGIEALWNGQRQHSTIFAICWDSLEALWNEQRQIYTLLVAWLTCQPKSPAKLARPAWKGLAKWWFSGLANSFFAAPAWYCPEKSWQSLALDDLPTIIWLPQANVSRKKVGKELI